LILVILNLVLLHGKLPVLIGMSRLDGTHCIAVA